MGILDKDIDAIASRIIEEENSRGSKGHDSSQTRKMQSDKCKL